MNSQMIYFSGLLPGVHRSRVSLRPRY